MKSRLKKSVALPLCSLLMVLNSGGFWTSLTGTAQERKLPEPETIGVVYWLDTLNGSLVPLERQKVIMKASGLFTIKVVVQLKGERASLRLKADQKPEFVVQLANGVDPKKFSLFVFHGKKGKREVLLGKAGFGVKADEVSTLSCDVTKFGQSSYKIVPSQPLTPGEYGFLSDSDEAFCFGVEPR